MIMMKTKVVLLRIQSLLQNFINITTNHEFVSTELKANIKFKKYYSLYLLYPLLSYTSHQEKIRK